MNLKTALIVLLISFSMAQSLQAASMEQEIQHLLQFVEKSGCSFERNGTTYDSGEARFHIQRKYEYLRDRIETTEMFIRHAASQSSMTGRQYHVSCKGRSRTSKEWLEEELQRYRRLSNLD